MAIQALLRSRNRALSRLIEVTSGLLAKLREGQWDILNEALSNRDAAFKAFELFERKINDMDEQSLKNQLTTESSRQQTAELVRLSDEMRAKLKDLDQEISRLIEKEQIEVLKDISKSRQFSNTVEKFKSHGGEPSSGEGMDQTL